MARMGQLTIGDVARRTGLSVSAIRYYESEGLVAAVRSAGGRRLFARSDIRRLSFVVIVQRLGFSLDEIRTQLKGLPMDRAPTRADWARISRAIRTDLETRIAMLERLREKLDGCIGCGCLSLDNCVLYNPQDKAARAGPGPRFVLGDTPPT